MSISSFRFFAGVLAFVLLPLSLSAATLTTTGATGVDVGGTLYDVEFVDGTCIALFDGCNDGSDFTFTTLTIGAAMQALLDLVDAAPLIDADPRVTGCTFTRFCNMFTPYRPFASDRVLIGFVQNRELAGSDVIVIGPTIAIDFDYAGSNSGQSTFAKWTPSVAVVPIPASILLLGSGFAGLMGFGRLRRKRT